MNLLVKFLPVLLDTLKALTTKGGLKSKTVIFGALLILLGGVQAMLPDLTTQLGQWGPLVSSAIGLVVVALRTVTDKPLDSKLPPTDQNTDQSN